MKKNYKNYILIYNEGFISDSCAFITNVKSEEEAIEQLLKLKKKNSSPLLEKEIKVYESSIDYKKFNINYKVEQI